MTRPSQGAQLALVVLGLVAAAAAGWLFLIAPQRTAVAEVERQLGATQTQIDRLRVRAATSTPGTPQVAVDAAELFGLTKAMPERVDLPGVLIELDRLASDTGIVFESITPRAVTPGNGYEIQPIDVAFEGNFYELSDFLFRVRTLVAVRDGKLDARGRLYNVESIAFAQAPSKFPRLLATVTINAYVLAGGTGIAPPADASPVATGAAS